MTYDKSNEKVRGELSHDLYEATVPQLSVEEFRNDPPSNPSPGDVYIVGENPAGEIFNPAVKFNHNKKQKIEIPAEDPWNNWDGLSRFTIEFVYKTKDDTHDHILFTTKNSTNSTAEITGILKQSGILVFKIRDTSGNRHITKYVKSFNMFDGNPKRLSFVRNGFELTNSAANKVYVNGSELDVENEIIDNKLKTINDGKIFIGQNAQNLPGTTNSLRFDAGDEVDMSESIFNPSNDYTVEFWLKADSINGNPWVFSGYDNTNSMIIQLDSDTNGDEHIYVFDGENDIEGPTITLNRWIHFALVYDANNETRLYYDGDLVKTQSNTNGTSDEGFTTQLGERDDGQKKFDGEIADFRIWNDLRSKTEIDNNKQKVLDGTENNLELLYKFADDNDTSTAKDSANAYDGTINGCTYVALSSFDETKRPEGNMVDFRVWSTNRKGTEIKDDADEFANGREKDLATLFPLTSFINANSKPYEFECQKAVENISTRNNSRSAAYTVYKSNATALNIDENDLDDNGIGLSKLDPIDEKQSFESKENKTLPYVSNGNIDRFFQENWEESSIFTTGGYDGDYVIGWFEEGFAGDISHPAGLVARSCKTVNNNLLTGRRLSKLKYYWQERSSNEGGGIQLRNTNGVYEMGFASNGPEWVLDDADNNETQIFSGDGTERWIEVILEFDWKNNKYSYDITDQATLSNKNGSSGLVSGKNVASIDFWTYNGGWGNKSNYQMGFDSIKIESDTTNDNNNSSWAGKKNKIATWNGTAWKFFDPRNTRNPRAFIKSKDAIFRWKTGSWDEIAVQGSGASSQSAIDRIESGSLPTGASDGDAIIDARHGEVEWLRVYDSDRAEWRLEGVGQNISDVDDKQFNWDEGTLDKILETTSTGELELDV